ncbi:MAG: Uma2 family endonuclease [Cyanobacteria bacterium J06631_9]
MTATLSQLHANPLQDKTSSKVVYPSGDGKPVAETYDHLYALLVTLEVLRQYLLGQQATVLANQFLYYAENFPKLRVAPDVMVIFGVEPGGRDSFKVWEEKAIPSVIFEMTSKGTRQKDESSKHDLYEGLGVTEYWQFDPKGEWIATHLKGYRLVDGSYSAITDNTSQVLQLRLEHEDGLIVFYQLKTGERLLSPDELRLQAEQAAKQAEQAVQRAEKLAEKLRSLGIDPDEV